MFGWLKRFLRRGRQSRLGESRRTASDTGRRGEKLARAHLSKLGYRILAVNWRSDEIDLVALDGEVIVFVEVKTRGADALVAGRHAVDARKKRVLRRAAYAYLRGLERPLHSVRFDVVEVALPKPDAIGETVEPLVRHFKAVPLFPKTLSLGRGGGGRDD